MSDRHDAVSVEHRSPEEAFALLGNETRVAILRELGESVGEPVPFSELRERVGVRDSGQFNYHLGKLADHFVRRTDEGDEADDSEASDPSGRGGYELTMAGAQIIGAMLAGTYTADASIDPIPVEGECPSCGGDVVAEYEDEHAYVHCTECADWYNRFSFPPGALDQFDREELPAAFDRWLRTEVTRVVGGFCSNCAGRMTGRAVPDVDRPDGVAAVYECGRCGDTLTASVTTPVFYHSAAVSFLYDHGIDAVRAPSWDVAVRVDVDAEVTSTDPLAARVTIAADDERLVATVDEHAEVVDVAREAV